MCFLQEFWWWANSEDLYTLSLAFISSYLTIWCWNTKASHLRECVTPAAFRPDFLILLILELLFRCCQPQQPCPSFASATLVWQGSSFIPKSPYTVFHFKHSVYVFVWVYVVTMKYKSTEGSRVSGLMEERMTNKNSEVPFIVGCWVSPFLFFFYDFLNLFSPQGCPPLSPLMCRCAGIISLEKRHAAPG